MIKILTVVLLVFSCATSYTQKLKVTNQSSLEPIGDVFIYHQNETNTAITLEDGEADLSDFPNTGSVTLQHPGFLTKEIEIEKLEAIGYRISLVERVLEIGELTVTSNRWEQDKDEVSQEILSISPKTIAFQNPTTSADLLAQSGEVFVQKSQLGGGSPMLRGFSANSVLLVVDGVRLNNAIYRSGNLQNVINIDPHSLEGAEVIYGPGSVMYGSDAMGGVMDFHTRKLKFIKSDKPSIKGSTFGRFSSAANEKTGNLNLSLSGKKVSFFGSFTKSEIGDLRSGSNRSSGYEDYFLRENYVRSVGSADFLVRNQDPNVQKESGYELTNALAKIGVKTGENSELNYGLYFSTTSDIPRYDRLTTTIDNTDSLVYAKWYYGPQKWMMHNLSFTSYTPTTLFNQIKVTAAYQRYEESRNDRRFGDDRLRTTSEAVDLYTLSLDLDKEFSQSSLFYGVDFFYNDVTSVAIRTNINSGEVTPTSSRYPSGGSQYASAALYANYVYRLNPKWTINGGARFSAVNLTANTDDTSALNLLLDDLNINNQAVNGMVGAVFRPSEKTKWNVLFSSGFRAPNIDDVGKLFEVDDDVVVVPNANLKPEFSYNQELGYQQKINGLTVDMVVFHSILTDAIVRGEYQVNGQDSIILDGDAKAIRAQINADKARIYGGSVKLAAEINDYIGATASLTATEGYLTENNQPLRHIPPVFGRAGMIYKLKKFRAEVYADYNFTKPASDIPPSEIEDKAYLYTATGTPGWMTLNIKSQYAVSQHIVFQLGLENIVDQHYRPYSSGISAPGRNLIIAVRGKF